MLAHRHQERVKLLHFAFGFSFRVLGLVVSVRIQLSDLVVSVHGLWLMAPDWWLRVEN